MLEPPSDVDAREGETAEFACRLTPCMPPPRVAWYFETARPPRHGDRRPLVGGDRYRLRVTADGLVSLVVVDVQLTDAGVYTMSADSSAGTVEVTAVLTVHGQCMPACQLTLNPLIMVALWNRGPLYFCHVVSFFFFFYLFFPRLISAAIDWMSTILLHMVWP